MIRKVLIVLAMLACSAQAGQVIVDHVDGSWTDGTNVYVFSGMPVTFYIRLVNDNTSNAGGITNGFRVWTTGGTPFTPIHGDTIPVIPGWKQMFDLVFSVNHFSANGLGADTVGFGGSKMLSTGLPVGYDKLSYRITTGGVAAGETICIDSCYFPPTGTWLWTPGGAPSWSGRRCFEAAELPCRSMTYSECSSELSFDQCQPISYLMAIVPDPDGGEIYSILEGPGTINQYTGVWTYTPTSEDYGTTQLLRVSATDFLCTYITCDIMVTFVSHAPGDIDNDCAVNIEDLLYLVEYMFNEGPEPVFELADVDRSGEINIADLLYMADYMFNSGPPPVDPWG